MRKLYFALFFVFTCFNAYSQSPVIKITQTYYRSFPFQTEFSSFLKHLLNDPTLINKTIEKRTDTSLFYFHGTYKSHNPFFFKPKRMEIALTESIIPKNDSVPSDTVYIYQLLAFIDETKDGIQDVRKEFEKIHKRYKGGFFKANFMDRPVTGRLAGATYNYFDRLHALAPFALTWTGPNENKEMCLILTIRMSVRDNTAILPVPFYAL